MTNTIPPNGLHLMGDRTPEQEAMDALDGADGTVAKAYLIGNKSFYVREVTAMRLIRLAGICFAKFKEIARTGILDDTWIQEVRARGEYPSFPIKIAEVLSDLWQTVPDVASEIMCIIISARDIEEGRFVLENIGPIQLMDVLDEFTDRNPVEDIFERFFELQGKMKIKYGPVFQKLLARVIPSSMRTPTSPTPDTGQTPQEASPGDSSGSIGSTSRSDEPESGESTEQPLPTQPE